MRTVTLQLPADKSYLLDLLEEEVNAIAVRRVNAALEDERQLFLRVRRRDAALEQAIPHVARASARVDAAHNTRDELPSIHALIAAASGLRRTLEASKKAA